jgi:putative transcriptional regulator
MLSAIIFSIENTVVVAVKNKLKVYRAMHDLTQEQLADRIGVSRQTVIAIEANKYLPSLGLAFKIAKLFKVTVEDVFTDEESMEKNKSS